MSKDKRSVNRPVTRTSGTPAGPSIMPQLERALTYLLILY